MAALCWTRFWYAVSALVAAANACSIYDPSLLEPAPADEEGELGSGGSAGESENDAASGSGGVPNTGGTSNADSAPHAEAGGAAGVSGASGVGGAAGATCALSQPVARVFGAPDGGAIALRAAVSEIDLGDDREKPNAVRHRELGYDIDGLCSGTQGASCPPPAWPIRFETERPNGIDNSAGILFERLADGLPALGSSETSARIRAGRGTMFLRIDGYNGAADDAVVAVSLARTAPHVQPAWRGTDLWILAAADHEATPEQPKQLDTRGYVANNVLVARFSNLLFRVPNPGDAALDIALSRAVVTCRIDPNVAIQPFQARGCVLSGAWHYQDALRALRAYGLCPGEAAYAELRSLLCERVDLTAVGGSANPCDAISFALRFETVPAFFDSQALGELPQALERCSAPEVDSALDGC